MTAIEDAKALLAANGYTVLRTKSYLTAQHRQRIAESQFEWAQGRSEDMRKWAERCLDNDRSPASRVPDDRPRSP